MNSIYFLKNYGTLTINLTGNNYNNMPVGNTDFTFYRGVTNEIEFTVKDVDKKPFILNGKTISISVINFDTEEQMIIKEGIILDPYKARVKFIFDKADTSEWYRGFYKFNITIVDENNIERILYIDNSQHANGMINFSDDNKSKPTSTVEITTKQFYPTDGEIFGETLFISSAYPGTNELTSNKLMTIAFYFNNFTGNIKLQGSMQSQPNQFNENWFDIPLSLTGPLEYNEKTGIDVYNVNVGINWYRFVVNSIINVSYGFGTIHVIDGLEKILVKI